MHGLWFIAGNLVRDAAALNKREMLWNVWDTMRDRLPNVIRYRSAPTRT
jgi:hypothetical protein